MAEQLSLAIITLNEEGNIERCIQSVPFADEVVVVDSGSSDKTVEIAKACGAKVFHQEWLGFQRQKQLAVEHTSNRWVLALDADESLSSELADELKQLLSGDQLASYAAYKVPRLSYHFGRWIRHGGWYPDYQVRLLDKENAKWSGGELHEFVASKSVGTLKQDLHHYVFRDLSHQVQTNDRYSGLGAKKLFSAGSRFSALKMIFRSVFKFFECYVLKRGFLDGVPGLVIAVGAGYSMFLRYAKLYEMQSQNKN
ncbi:MAG: glycosyltransferase family 2 protein [Bdellovibrionales bacterium]|nr:glycosyltransferase family 2 protein [Bdellovibrionales bacterium]